MTAQGETIRPAATSELDAFFAYLEDHLKDNGANGGSLFQPLPRGTPWQAAGKAEAFRAGLATAIGAPGWRRLWLAWDGLGGVLN